VCRGHDRELKLQAVRSRPRRPAEEAEQAIPNVVRCGGCGTVLDERSDQAAELRQPCPEFAEIWERNDKAERNGESVRISCQTN
jgi:phage FluMu protein Com